MQPRQVYTKNYLILIKFDICIYIILLIFSLVYGDLKVTKQVSGKQHQYARVWHFFMAK